MSKSATKGRTAAARTASAARSVEADGARRPESRPTENRSVGRPARAAGLARPQIVVNTALLGEARRVTGRGKSDTVNAALAQLTENAAILDGVGALFGAFPDHPDQDAALTADDRGR